MNIKICRRCNLEKPVTQFHKSSKNGISYYKSKCKDCQSIIWKSYYNNNRDVLLEKKHQYDIENKTKILDYARRRRKENWMVYAIYRDLFYLENKEYFLKKGILQTRDGVQNMSDAYIKRLLLAQGIEWHTSSSLPKLIELKRELLTSKRIIKQK